MGTRMSTASRMDRSRDKHAQSRIVNGKLKVKMHASRDKRMAELIQKGTFPYTPPVQSWLSEKLGKPSTQITEEQAKDVAQKV